MKKQVQTYGIINSLRKALLLCLVLAAPTSALSQALTPQQITALNNLQEEYTRCSLYFHSQIACAPPAMKQEAENQLGPVEGVPPAGRGCPAFC